MSLEALLSDIREQPEVLGKHASLIEQVIEIVKKIDRSNGYVLTGIATSYFSLQPVGTMLRKIGKFNGQLTNTADLLDYDYPISKDRRPLFVVSRSGESAEIIRLVQTISPEREVVAITENAASPLAQRANYMCQFYAREQAFTNTKSFTLSLAYALGLAIGLGYDFPLKTREWVGMLVDALNETMNRWSHAERVASTLVGKQVILIEAQGHLTGIANQAALDFQELRIPSIPVTGGIFRHGSIELTARNDASTLVLVPGDETAWRKVRLIRELHANNSSVAAVVSENIRLPESIPAIYVPDLIAELQPVVYAFAMHMIYSSYINLKGLQQIKPSLVDKVTRKE